MTRADKVVSILSCLALLLITPGCDDDNEDNNSSFGSDTLPSGAVVTPGQPNFGKAPFVVLNEVLSSFAGGDAGLEYVELLSNELASFDKVYVLAVDGTGTVQLSHETAAEAGENGLILLSSPGARYSPAAKTVLTVNEFGSGILPNVTMSLLLVYSPNEAITAGTDLDSNNDGILDGLPASASILDAIGWRGDDGFIYSEIDLSLSHGSIDAASRLRGLLSIGKTAWGAGQLATATNYQMENSIGLPLDDSTVVVPHLTPGHTNISPLGSGIVTAALELPRTTMTSPDTDDPAFWVHPTDRHQSLIFVAQKEAGFSIYKADGQVVADLAGASQSDPIGRDVRFNNVDVIYGFDINKTPADTSDDADLVVFSDRQNDQLVIYRINPNSEQTTIGDATSLLTEVSDTTQGKIFRQSLQFPNKVPESDLNKKDTAYGLCTYKSPVSHDWYAFVTRNDYSVVNQLKLVAKSGGIVGWTLAREIVLAAEDTEMNGNQVVEFDENEHAEGLVADHQLGVVYIGQEDVGIYRVDAEPNGPSILTDAYLIDKAKKFVARIKNGEQVNLIPDIEGISLYYGAGNQGYLIASAQGVNSFALYERDFGGDRTSVPQTDGTVNAHLVNFSLDGNGAKQIDGVQETDGLDVINLPFGNFPAGVLCVQDGQDFDPIARDFSTNVKCVDWQTLSNTLGLRAPDTMSFNPRNPN
jgi:myo-inositol-hexaphosphate 3-phosphohydrolase